VKFKSTSARVGAALVLTPAMVLLACGPALADDVVVTNTETIQAYLNTNGTVDQARVYDQIALQGNGSVTIANPVSTENLRNLDGFRAFEVKNGKVVSTQTVDGTSRLRTVSDFEKQIPLKVSVSYKLDGKVVNAGDVVGKAGRLDVRYKVQNVTGKDQDVTYDDGTGTMITQTEKVVIPMVGSLTTVLPPNFVDVSSGEANIAGDGRGQTKMSFTMTLFGPIGSPTSEFGYSAKIVDGVIPVATITALPVNPMESPSFKAAAASYKGGAATGTELAAGATTIDSNLLKLRDGAQKLLAGLILLGDGATKLNAGLAGEAAPGSVKLADGAAKLDDGAGKLAAGAGDAQSGSGQLASGTEQLAAGATKLDAGAGQLSDGLNTATEAAPALLDGLAQVADGLEQVDAGLVKLYGGIGGLPAKAKPLHDGITQLLAGLGNKTTSGTLIYGVNAVRSGLADATKPGGSLDLLKGGVDQSKGGADAIKVKVDAALVPATGSLDQLRGAVAKAAATAGCAGDTSTPPTPNCAQYLGGVSNGLDDLVTELTAAQVGLGQISAGLGQVSPGLAELKTKLSAAAEALALVECGLSNVTLPGVCDTARPGLLQGLDALDAGVTQLVNGVVTQVQGAVGQTADVAPAQKTLRGGVHAVMGGVDLIGEGGLTLLDGLDRLNTGAGTLKTGTGDLVTGADKLASGADQLYVGLGKLSSGATQLSDGTAQLSTGASTLATGLGAAATGSGQLADGLTKASDGGEALPAGATKLSKEGTSKLVDAGISTASDYGLKYATIVAGADRVNTEAMAFGTPANAVGNTAYSLEISGANDDGGASLRRGLGALLLFGAGAGLLLYRRRTV
jgi:X-X-X-Leu-X-X-Gly heptad repeat protein